MEMEMETDTAKQAVLQFQKETTVAEWLQANADRILKSCGLTREDEEGANSKGEMFAQMLKSSIDRNFGGRYTRANLEAGFQSLINSGLLLNPTPPPPSKPARSFTLELRSTGAPTRVKGPFTEDVIRYWAQKYAKEQQSIRILDSQGRALDYDTLEPLVDNPLAQPRLQIVQTQQAQATAGTQAEYQRFFQTSRTDAIKSRARTDAGFRDWMARGGQLDFVKASSGGMSADGTTPAEPRKL